MEFRQFAATFKQLREARQMSQYRVAKITGLTPGYISRLEAGQRHPSYETVALIAKALGLQGEDRRRLFAAAGYLAPEQLPTQQRQVA